MFAFISVTVIPAGNAGIQLPWMAMFKLQIPFRISLLYRSIHPCGLDPGSPCRDDGFFVVSYFVWVCDF